MIKLRNLKMNEVIYKSSLFFEKNFTFYYFLLLNVNFKEDVKCPTMGVRVLRNGLEMVYNPKFLNALTEQQGRFILLHELKHFLLSHHGRTQFRDHKISNIVQDMIINTMIIEHFSKKLFHPPNLTKKQISEVYDMDIKEIKNLPEKQYFTVPKEYTDKKIFEKLYDWVLDQVNKREKDENGDSKHNPDLSKETNEMLDSIENYQKQKKIMDMIKDGNYRLVDEHLDDEVTPEVKKGMIDSLIEKAKFRGLVTSDIETMLNQLNPTKRDYLKEIVRSLSGLLGTKKHKTWQRFNRKDLPIKGYKKYQNKVNVMLDVSGSMSGSFEKVLSYCFRNNYYLNLIQVDTEIKKTEGIKNKKELQKVQIKGLGGTELQPGLNYIKENFNQYPTIILTDGYCENNLSFQGIKKDSMIITCGQKVGVKNNIKRVKQIQIEEEAA